MTLAKLWGPGDGQVTEANSASPACLSGLGASTSQGKVLARSTIPRTPVVITVLEGLGSLHVTPELAPAPISKPLVVPLGIMNPADHTPSTAKKGPFPSP